MKITKAKYLLFFMLTLLTSTFIPSRNTYAAIANDSSFWVEYIDVGQGNSVLIQCDGQYMMIDGGPSSASATVYTILKDNNIKTIDLMIATHPDADHIGGLSGALNYSKVDTFWCPVNKHDTKTFKSVEKYLDKQGKSIVMPAAGDTYSLGNATVTVLGPIYNNSETNNMSIVTRVTYGNTSFLFMGDAEEEEEEDILRRNNNLKSDVLMVGHHGSNSSTSNKLLKAVKPQYAVISVGKDNSYGHPTEDTLKKLSSADVTVYRTDMQGDVFIASDGKTLTVSTEKNVSAEEVKKSVEPVAIPTGTTYVLNTNSKKFHDPNCKSVNKISEKNRQFTTESPETLVVNGYSPCGNCKPYTIPESVSNIDNSANSAQTSATSYVLNTNTKKFHYPNCSSVSKMSAKNRRDVTDTRDSIISQGYVPCKKCNP